MSGESESEIQRPELDAWRKTDASGEPKKIVVGEWWHGPKRIEIDPDSLITDPDAEVEDG